MNNYEFLSIVNTQIVKPKNLANTELNGQYMLCISGFIGYHRNLACAIYIKITDKLKETSKNNGLYELIFSFTQDLSAILIGNKNFILGEDYYISESLYDFITNFDPDDSSDSSDNIDSSSDIYSSDSTEDSSHSSDPSGSSSQSSDSSGDNTPNFPPGIVVIAGPDVNYTLSLTSSNKKLLEDNYSKNSESRKTILTKAAPYIPQDVIDDYMNSIPGSTNVTINVEDGLSEEEENIIEQIIKQEYVLPDYILYYTDFSIKQNFEKYEDLSDIKNKDFSNLDWFNTVNESQVTTYDTEELQNLPKSFFSIIIKHAVVQNYYENINNQIYHAVMNYWANGGFDDASNNIALILGTMYATSTTTTCGCNGINKTDTSTESCKDMYTNAMLEWLIKMLSDTEYYYDWFFTPGTGECPAVNSGMIDMLITLLREFINQGRDLSFSNSRAHCECPNVDYDNGACNYAILENYIKVLNWVKQNNIEANSNKIKVYGTQFAELLPKLVF